MFQVQLRGEPEGHRRVYEDADEAMAFLRSHAGAVKAPCDPRVVVGMAHNNYPDGVGRGRQAFLKSCRSVIGYGGEIRIDPGLGRVQAEVELALVVGSTCSRVKAEDAWSYVRGVCVGNDVTAVEQNSRDPLLTQSKNGIGFTPVGPFLTTGVRGASGLRFSLSIDGELVSSGDSSGLIYSPEESLEYVSRYVVLGPGDVILCGSPSVWHDILPGQTVTARIDGFGEVTNTVSAIDAPLPG